MLFEHIALCSWLLFPLKPVIRATVTDRTACFAAHQLLLRAHNREHAPNGPADFELIDYLSITGRFVPVHHGCLARSEKERQPVVHVPKSKRGCLLHKVAETILSCSTEWKYFTS